MKKVFKRRSPSEIKILDLVYRFLRQGIVIKVLLFILLGITCLTFLVRTTTGFLIVAKLVMLFVPGTLTFKNPNGRLMDSIQIESVFYKNESLKVEINHLSFQWQPLILLHHRVLPIDKIQADSVILTHGKRSQRFDHPHLSANISPRHIQLSTFTVTVLGQQLVLKGTLQPFFPYKGLAHLELNPAHATPTDKLLGAIELTGDIAKYTITGTFHGPTDLTFNGTLNDLSDLHVTSQWQYLRLPQSVDEVRSEQGVLQFFGKLPHLHIQFSTLASSTSLAHWKINTTADATLPWLWNIDALVQRPNLPKIAPRDLQTAIHLSAAITDPAHGNLMVSVQPGHYHFKDNDFLKSLPFQGGTLKAILNPTALIGKGDLGLDENKKITVTFRLPKFRLDNPTKANQWYANGNIVSNHQSLSLQGKGQLNPDPFGEIRLQGNQFLIANTPSYQVSISPQLVFNFTPTSLKITGSLIIPSAQIQPPAFTESITIPNDITFKTKEQKKSLPFNTTVDVNVVVHNQVTLNYEGLNTHLNGSLHLTQIPPNPLSAEGSILLTDGTYKAYGQNLTIKQGHLFFTGGGLDNPSIRLRAGKYIKEASNKWTNGLTRKVRVGVQVSGQLSEPTLHLFSIPATFSQADILSLLVLGIPANQASGAGSQLLITALSSIAQGTQSEDTQLLSQLKKIVGIDFDFKSKDNKLGVVLSKSLTKRISIGYTIGLSQADPNVMTLKYILTKLISLQISSSASNSGIDALYEKEIP